MLAASAIWGTQASEPQSTNNCSESKTYVTNIFSLVDAMPPMEFDTIGGSSIRIINGVACESARTKPEEPQPFSGITAWLKADSVSRESVIRELAKAGLVCEVLGHKWEGGCNTEASGFGCLVNHGPARHCSVCGKEQYKKPEEWE
jgi:hypothetical protein